MSTIGVTYHDEDIRNIIKIPKPPMTKPQMYKSKKRKEERPVDHKFKSGHQTFGLAHYETPKSTNFLKKKSGDAGRKVVEKKADVKTTSTKPCSVPPRTVAPLPKTSGKNYVKENIKWVSTLEPKAPCPRKVDSPRGTVKDLKHLIEMIKIRERDEYGKVPDYLCERKRKLQEYLEKKRKLEEIEYEYREKMGIGRQGMDENLYMIDQETREKLIAGLKEHWNELSKQFLRLPVMCDTMAKEKRKIWLEREIDRVERDVKLVESHPYIYLERSDKRSPSQVALDLLRQQEELEKKAEEERRKAEEEAAPEATEDPKGDVELVTHDYAD